MSEQREKAKWVAARAACGMVESGMVVGLGTGSTAIKFLDLLAERVRQEGLKVTCVATSEKTGREAGRRGLAMVPGFPDFRVVDLTVDGADEVDPAGNLIKGGGGALLREKLVALASRRVVIVVDPDKHVAELGHDFRLPVEVVPFGWSRTLQALRGLGAEPGMRRQGDEFFRTDHDNYIIDCRFAGIPEPAALHARIKSLSGVVETGIFPGLAHAILTGHPDGTWDLRELPV
jgi:ribose 5-phosphate isomerase A